MLHRLPTYLLLAAFWMLSTPGMAQHIDSRRLDSLLLKPARGHMPGFAVRILHNNEVVYEGHSGYANIAAKKQMNSSSVVNTASLTKQFTAYAIFLLEERGELNTADEIHAYLPELPDFGAPITLNQLLTHTSGLRDYPEMLSLMNQSTNQNLQYDEMVKFLQSHCELNFQPGERFCYSNTGYMMLARVIEKVSGYSYCAFLNNELFQPLEMDHTFVNEGILNQQADGTTNYTLHRGKTLAKKDRPHRDLIGSTGIFSNLEDLTKWNRLFWEYESGKSYSGIIARMETAGTLNDGSSCHYGGGLILKQYRGEPVVEHSGEWSNYRTQLRRFPLQHLTIIVATNSQLDSPFEICDRISDLVLDFGDSAVAGQDALQLTMPRIDGTYISEDNIVRYVVTDSVQPLLKIFNASRTSCSTYRLENIESLADQSIGMFLTDSAGNSLTVKYYEDGPHRIIWNMGTYFQTRRTYTRVAPFSGIDRSHAGKYYIAEIDRTVRIRYNGRKKKLVYRPLPFKKHDLIPIGDSIFQVRGETYLLRFDNNGIVFGNDWIYNLDFGKKGPQKQPDTSAQIAVY
jgi:CubicO group peptidase (beta-lactamase class C family)